MEIWTMAIFNEEWEQVYLLFFPDFGESDPFQALAEECAIRDKGGDNYSVFCDEHFFMTATTDPTILN